jgi:hypothetical protein
MGLSTLKDNSDKIKSEAKNYNLIFWWGVNGLEDGYSAVYKDIANSLGDQSTVFVGTVGRVMNTGGGTLGTEGGWGDTTVDDFNEKIKSWNENLKAELSGVSNIHVLDIWQFIEDLLDEKTELELAAGAGNGLHYSADLYQRIYDWVCSQITNQELGKWADFAPVGEKDIMTIYDGLRQSGFSKNGAIGALANMSHESGWISHMIGGNSSYFIGYGERSAESLLDLMNSATSGEDLYNTIQRTSTDGNPTGYGLTQFTSQENIGNLFRYHTETGLAYDRLGVQLPAFIQVLKDNDYWDETNSSASPGDAAYYLCINYERPANKYAEAANRRVDADNLAARYDFYD